MSALSITPPFPTFAGKDGLPLEDGYIWLGAANLNPQTNPLVAYWDEALTQIAQQPIRTLGGYPAYSGTPARLFIAAAVYSILVQDKNGNTVYTSPSNTGPSTFINFSVNEEVQVATAGQTVFTLANTYSPGTNSLTVYVDGVNQYDGYGYAFVETSGDTVTFTSGLHVGALVKFSTAIQLSGGVADSSQVTYLPAGTGAVVTNVQTKLRETVSVKDFGAVGDGVTDDTAALQAFFDACKDGRGYMPPGKYKITSALTLLPQHSYNIEGACYDNQGLAGTIIYNAGVGNAIELANVPYAGQFDREIRLAHLVIDGNPSSQDGINVEQTMIYLEYVWCRGHGRNGIFLRRGYASSFRQVTCANNHNHGMFVTLAGNALHFDHCVFNGNGLTIPDSAGLYFTGIDPDGYNFGVVLTSCDFSGNAISVATGFGVVAQYCRGISFIGCYGELNKTWSFYADATTKNLNVTGCYWQDGNIYIEDIDGLIYENNHHNRTVTSTDVTIDVGLPNANHENRIFGNTYNGGAAPLFTGGASSNAAIFFSTPPTGGTWQRGDIVWRTDFQQPGQNQAWVCVTPGTPGTWLATPQTPGVGADNGNDNITLIPFLSFPTQTWRTPLTGNRTVTFSSTNLQIGVKWRLVRTATATGAFTIDAGGLKSLADGQWCDVEWDGSFWVLTAFGSL